MTKRILRDKALGYGEFVLASAKVAEQGHTACLNTATGMVQPAESGITTLLAIGTFALIQEMDGITGDGVKKVTVKFPAEVAAIWRDNDEDPNAVAAADIGNPCYLKDSVTVSTDDTNRSEAGRVLAVDAYKGVLVQFGIANTGPTGSVSSTGAGVADRDALSAIAAASRYDGKQVLVRSDGSLWRFVSASTAVEDEAQDLVVEPDAGTGRWVRADKAFTIKAPITFETADDAVILTVPAGFALRLAGLPYWEVTTAFTGGASSAIGVDADLTGFDTKGDILGGAAGDVAADLTAGIQPGTVGAKLDNFADQQAFVLDELAELHFGRITSAFTAGAGFVCVPVVAMTPA